MKRNLIFVVLILFCFGLSATAQDNTTSSTEETYQPNIRGSLLFGVGLNFLSNAPTPFEIIPFRSKSVNLYYLYEIRLGDSKFAFNPGFGLGFEKYQFEEGYILSYDNNVELDGLTLDGPVLVMDTVSNVISNVPGASFPFSKNRLAANYLDFPMEFSFASNKSNPESGLKVAIGGKVGYLFSSHVKIKYEAGNDDNRTLKQQQQWGLNRLRYGAHARVGYGSFSLYFEYQLSPLFNSAFDGPLIPVVPTAAAPGRYQRFPEVQNFRVGLSFDLF